jgi:Tol biopolymer transport system component
MKILISTFSIFFVLIIVILLSCDIDKAPLSPNSIFSDNTEYNIPYENKILFTSNRKVNNKAGLRIFLMNEDGSDIQNIINDGISFSATWSPNKWKILYTSHRDLNENSILYQVDYTGKNRRQISLSTEDVTYGKMSPKGNMIAYIVQKARVGSRIKLVSKVNPDGKFLTDWMVALYRFSWSPDSRYLYFSAAFYSYDKIYSLNVETSELKQVFDYPEHAIFYDLSKSGIKILFSGINTFNVYDMNTKQITLILQSDSEHLHFSPNWSPNEEYIVFDRRELGAYAIDNLFRINSDGSNMVQLTDNLGNDYAPNW